MKIVQLVNFSPEIKINRFVATKGDHGIADDLDIPVIVGIPFEVPDELGQARIKASPNLYRIATPADDEFAKKYKAEQKNELDDIIKTEKEGMKDESEATKDVFDAAGYLLEGGPHTEGTLGQLDRKKLIACGKELELDFPNNIPNQKLIAQILEKVTDKE